MSTNFLKQLFPISNRSRTDLPSLASVLTGCVFVCILISCGAPPKSVNAGTGKKLGSYLYDSTRTTVLLRSKSGIEVTDSMAIARLKRSEFMVNGGEVDFSTLTDFVDSVMCDTLAGLEAPGVRLQDHPLDFRIYRLNYYQYLVSYFWSENIDKVVSVDSLDAIQVYRDSSHLFSVKEQVNAYHIFVSADGFLSSKDSVYYSTFTNEDREQLAEERIWTLWRILNFGEAFQNVAYDYSHDWRTRPKGGYIGWTTRQTYDESFDTIAFNLDPFKHSRPFKDKSGWNIIMVDGHIKEGPVPIDSASVYESALLSARSVKMNLRGDSILTAITKDMMIVPNPAILDTNIYFVDDATWCAIVNGVDTIDAWRLKTFEESYRKAHRIANTTSEVKKEMFRDLGKFYAVVQAARKTGIDTLDYAKKSHERLKFKSAKQVVMVQAYDPGYAPSQQLIERFYKKHEERFYPVRPYTFDLLTVNDSVFAAFCWEQLQTGFEMQDLIDEYHGKEGKLLSMAHFDTVGVKEIGAEHEFAAKGTPLRKYSRPYRTKDGFHILRLLDIRDFKPLPTARPEIVTQLIKERNDEVWQSYRDRLFRKYAVERLVPLAGTINLAAQWERMPTAEEKFVPAK